MGVERRVFLGLALAGTAAWGLDDWLNGSDEAGPRLPAKVRLASSMRRVI